MTSKVTVNMVVGLLGLALLGCIGGAIGLSAASVAVPQQMWTVGSTALGALAAVLVSTRSAEAGAIPQAPPVVPVPAAHVEAPLPPADTAAPIAPPA